MIIKRIKTLNTPVFVLPKSHVKPVHNYVQYANHRLNVGHVLPSKKQNNLWCIHYTGILYLYLHKFDMVLSYVAYLVY